jgi:Mg-chelatase subunit ChlD
MLVAALVTVLVVGVGACAGIDDGNHVAADASPSTRADAAGILLDARRSDGQLCTEPGVMPIAPQPADVLVLLDRSSSMETAFGSGSRYQAVSAVLSDLVTAFQYHVRFGYMEMPGRDGCGEQAQNCCVSPPRVELELGNAQAMTSALAGAAPLGGGSTPMAAALLAARLHYGVFGGSVGNRYVLMATDGVPGCTLSGALSNGSASVSPACVDAKDQVDALVQSGVKVIVLSLGPNPTTSPDDDCLEVLAQAGGAPRTQDGPGYYSAADPNALATAIEQIFGAFGTPSCYLAVPAQAGKDRPPVSVYLDGQEIPNSAANGWTWVDSSGQIAITGAYCKQIQQFQVGGFEALYPCPVGCIERGDCVAGPPPN